VDVVFVGFVGNPRTTLLFAEVVLGLLSERSRKASKAMYDSQDLDDLQMLAGWSWH